ncbi:MAG: hypothetical protein ACREBU_05035 [Nitrososphaera sp.]
MNTNDEAAMVNNEAATINNEVDTNFLLNVARGKYDQQIKYADKFIIFPLSKIFRSIALVRRLIKIFLKINKLTAPSGVVKLPDGSFVSDQGQSVYDPETGLFTGKKAYRVGKVWIVR